MIPLPDGTFRYFPRDLVAYLEGDFAAWCDRMLAERKRAGGAGSAELEWATPDENDPEAELAIRMGNEHEQRHLRSFRERYPTILELDRADPEGPARTLAAMGEGVPVIYQAHLVSDGWGGFPDFLVRCTTPGHLCATRGWHYTPWDTKLARSAKPAFLLQLCAYADLLEAISGFRPGEIVFVLGQGVRTGVSDPALLPLLPPPPPVLRRVPVELGRVAAFPTPVSTGAGDAGRRPPRSCSKRPTT